jgi:alpha-1,2-mannosyltransferase
VTRLREKIENWFNGSTRARKAAAVLIAIAAFIALIVAIKKAFTRELDIYVILNASRNLLAGADIYSSPATNGAYYLYLPLLAFLFIPLALLPQGVAGVLWMLVSIALIAWSLHECVKLVAGDRYTELSAFELWALHLIPMIFCADAISAEIGNAQMNCIILAATILALKFADRRQVAAGAILGVATVAKVFAAPLLFYELLNKRFRVVVAGMIAAAASLLVPAVVVGWQRNLDYVSYWMNNIALYGDLVSHRSGFTGNASIQAILTRLLTNEPAFVWNGAGYRLNFMSVDPALIERIGMTVPVIALLLLVVYFVWFRRGSPLDSYLGGIALAFCISPLITPIVERPHFVMLLPAYVYVSWIWLHRRLRSTSFYVLLATAFVLSTFTLKLYVGEFWGNVFWSLGAPTIADLCLIAAIFVATTHQKAPDLTAAG